MIKLFPYINRLMKLPLPNRREINKIIKEIYQSGRADEKKLLNKKTK